MSFHASSFHRAVRAGDGGFDVPVVAFMLMAVAGSDAVAASDTPLTTTEADLVRMLSQATKSLTTLCIWAEDISAFFRLTD